MGPVARHLLLVASQLLADDAQLVLLRPAYLTEHLVLTRALPIPPP